MKMNIKPKLYFPRKCPKPLSITMIAIGHQRTPFFARVAKESEVLIMSKSFPWHLDLGPRECPVPITRVRSQSNFHNSRRSLCGNF